MGGPEYGLITNTDQYPAQRFSKAIDRFVTEFTERNDLGKLQKILTTSTRLKRDTVGQRPETFTERHLIVPGLEALGYSIHRERPGEFVSGDQSEPDFSVKTDYAEHSYIVEAKKLASLPAPEGVLAGKGSKQLKGYLKDDFSAKYRTDLDRQYLVGIATDGVDWIVFKKDLNTGEIDPVGSASAESAILQTVKAHRKPGEVSRKWRVEVRRQLESDFVPEISAENVAAAVSENEN